MASSLEYMLFIIAILPSSIIGIDLCPATCRCDDEQLRASCVFADLDIVPIQLNPEIHHLDLSNNRIVRLQHEVQLYKDLESLDLSSNIIHTLGNENFLWLEQLVTLNVSNNSVHNISKKSLKGLISLRNLDLSNNNISNLEERAFHSTTKLEYLNLSGNSLNSLPTGLFTNLSSIVILDLSRNSLLEMPSNNLVLTPKLFTLNLANNLIENVPADSLSSLKNLKYLNLASNMIRSIADDAFKQLQELTYLSLEENYLTQVPTITLSNLNGLSSLILSKNPLSTIESQAFSNMLELKHLDLRKCKIKTIEATAFTDNANLETIYLDGNRQLEELPQKVLYGSYKNLKTVSIRNCQLSTLQPTQFPVDQLTTLRLGGNPLVCNCSVQWLWSLIHTEEERNETHLSLDSDEIVCADEEFFSKPLKTLSEGSLRCRMSTLYLTLSAAGCLMATGIILALIAYVTRAKRQKRPSFAPPNRPELLVYVEPNTDTAKSQPRLIARKEEGLYDLPHGKSTVDPESFYEAPYCNPRSTTTTTTTRSTTEGVYAVADVTDLRDTPPEVLSLYRIHQNTPASPKPSRTRRTLPTGYDYEYRPPLPHHKPHIVFV